METVVMTDLFRILFLALIVVHGCVDLAMEIDRIRAKMRNCQFNWKDALVDVTIIATMSGSPLFYLMTALQ
jgi:hypothetical protein